MTNFWDKEFLQTLKTVHNKKNKQTVNECKWLSHEQCVSNYYKQKDGKAWKVGVGRGVGWGGEKATQNPFSILPKISENWIVNLRQYNTVIQFPWIIKLVHLKKKKKIGCLFFFIFLFVWLWDDDLLLLIWSVLYFCGIHKIRKNIIWMGFFWFFTYLEMYVWWNNNVASV